MLRVLVLVGFKESGKSTFFDVASSIVPCQEIMLASRLKRACSKAFGVSEDDFTDQNKKENQAVFDEKIGGDESTLFDEAKLREVLRVFDLLTEDNVQKCLHTTGVKLETPRRMAQYVGTEVLRNNIDSDIHIKTAIPDMDSSKLNIVTDGRFPNEIDYFVNSSEMKATTIFILRPDKVPADLKNIHPSESHILSLGANCNHTLRNENYEEYKKDVSSLIAKITSEL